MAIKMQQLPRGLTVQDAFEKFIKSRKARNVSIRTISFYQENYKILREFIDVSAVCVEDLDAEFVDNYIVYLQDKGTRNANSINTAIRALKAFLNFSMERGYMTYFKIKLTKVDREVKESYTPNEIKKLIKAPISNKFSTYRTWVLIQYMLMTGNRAGTVVELKIKDIDFKNRQINIRKCKNRKGYMLPLNANVETLLKEYLNQWVHSESDYLFPAQSGQAMTVSGLQNAVRRYCIKREVTKTSVHLFRYSFARQYMLNGGKLERLSYLLGHSTTQMTQHYLNTSADEVASEYDKMEFLPNVV